MPADIFIVSRSTQKKYKNLPPHIRKRTIKAFNQIQKDPTAGIKLGGDLTGFYKYRIGDYRIIYSFSKNDKKVSIYTVEHRQGVYR